MRDCSSAQGGGSAGASAGAHASITPNSTQTGKSASASDGAGASVVTHAGLRKKNSYVDGRKENENEESDVIIALMVRACAARVLGVCSSLTLATRAGAPPTVLLS